MNTIYGYIRVSSNDQNIDRQIIEMKKNKVEKENLFIDKISGKDFNRPNYKRMMRKIKEGDLLYICSIDRLGRNYLEIQNEWQKITKEKKVDIVVIDMPLLDTRIGKDLLNTFIADLVFQILSFIAENERDTIKRRQREGIEAAKLRGVVFGRPRKKIPNNFLDIISDMKKGKIKKTEAAKLCNVVLTTFYKLLKQCDF